MERNISIIIPTFRKVHRLELTLMALERQDYSRQRYEIIVVNDACDEAVDSLVKEFKDMQIKSIPGEGKGPACAKNKAIYQARGEIFVFLDDDVLCASDFLKNHASYYENEDFESTVVTAKRKHIYLPVDDNDCTSEINRIIKTDFKKLAEISYDDPHCSLLDQAYTNGIPNCNAAWVCLNGCNFSAASKLIRKVNLFDSNLSYLEDTDIGLRMWENGGKFNFCEKALNYHMEHAIDVVGRKNGWEKNYHHFEEQHGITAKLYAMFFHGEISLAEFSHYYKEQILPEQNMCTNGSYWFWEEFALRRWRKNNDARS